MKKICCLFNYNPLYRFPIYNAMAKELNCDFYFGDSVFEPLKQFNAEQLPGFKSFLIARKISNSFIWYSGVSKLLKRKYDTFLLTGSPCLLANWIIIAYAKLFRKKIYCWCHGPKTFTKNLTTRLLIIPFYKAMDGIFMYNKYNEKFMLSYGISEKKIHIIHNSLDTNVQTRIYNSIKPSNIYTDHFKNNNPVIIFIGRIQKRMKVQMLVDAIEILNKRGRKANLVLVGPYMDGENIELLIEQKGLKAQTWLYGASYKEEVTSNLLYDADVCVAPGTVGLTAIHSISYGTPVITHNNFSNIGPEFEAIIPGKTGDFFEENDVNSLTDIIEKWIGLSIERRNEIRKHARETILSDWSVDYQINLLKKIMDR